MVWRLQRKAAIDGGDLKVSVDGGAEYIDDDDDDDGAAYLHREDAAPKAEYIDDDANLHHGDAPTAGYIDAEADLHRESISSGRASPDRETDAPVISSPDREVDTSGLAWILLGLHRESISSGRASPDRETDAPVISSPDREVDTSGLPAWILLDPVSYSVDEGNLGCENETTAEAQTVSWREDGVKVSFSVANPPHPSHFSIHVPSLVEKPYLLCGRPSILYTVRNLALISVTFDGYNKETEYYLYRVVGPGQRPTLVHLDYISEELKKVFHVVKVGLLPRDGDDGFVLAALALEQAKGSEKKEEHYSVHVFQFERGTWTSKVHVLERHQIGNLRLYNVEKVIALSVEELGFVDLWNGILAFNVLQENLTPQYIPLPKLLPGNNSDDQLGLSAKYFRDVIFSTDGLIKCVELEMCWKHIAHEKPNRQGICTESQDVWESEVLFDVDLMHQIVDENDENEKVEETFEYLGWRFICWSRKSDFDCWRKDCSIYAKDIINTELNELSVSFPTLSMDGTELYIVSKVNTTELESRVIMVDLVKNSIKAFSPFPIKRPDFFQQTYVACDLFKCMNTPSDKSQVYGHKALFLRLPFLEHKNVLSVRTSESMEPDEAYESEPDEASPVGLQLILLDDQEASPVGLQFILLDYQDLVADGWPLWTRPYESEL